MAAFRRALRSATRRLACLEEHAMASAVASTIAGGGGALREGGTLPTQELVTVK